MIDTHCHLTYEPLLEHVHEVVKRANQAGVERMIVVGTTPEDALKAVALAEQFDCLFATVGLHPHYVDDWPNAEVVCQQIRELAAHPKVVAIGEMGLDCHYPDPPLEKQKRLFQAQLDVAATLDLPIIIHNRKATDHTIAMLKASGISPTRFVFHCFTGSLEEFQAIIDFGAMISFTGITTFKSAPHVAQAATRMPRERIMVETDSPFLAPVPHRKVRPNEPCYVMDVARFIAARRETSLEDFEQLTTANAERFFRLPTVIPSK